MVDKMGKISILTSATPLNRTGKEPGTGALSHSIANQTKLYFGLRTTRLITGLFKGVATLNSNRSDWAGGFLFRVWPGCRDAYDTPTPLTKANPEVAMADRILPILLPDANSGDFSNLSEAELSRLLDLLTSQIEYHRDELTRLKPLLHRLQAKIPNDPIADFINSLD